MKKWIKLWAIALSILALAGTIVSVNAQTNTEDYTAEVCLFNSGNVCTLGDYDFWDYAVSSSEIDLNAVSHNLNCELYTNDAWNVTLELTDLTWANGTIARTQFSLAAPMSTSSYYTWSLSVWSDVSVASFATTQTMYAKTLNEIWEIIDASVTLDGVIPAWQAAGTYQGTLHLLYPAGTVVTCS
jgi:hypothetical protein